MPGGVRLFGYCDGIIKENSISNIYFLIEVLCTKIESNNDNDTSQYNLQLSIKSNFSNLDEYNSDFLSLLQFKSIFNSINFNDENQKIKFENLFSF
jgi:hypothetical protein